MEKFDEIFRSPKSKEIGIKLKSLVNSYFEDIEESIVGGAKVKLVLYSRNGKNNVLCGIQEGSNDSCMLYVHHINKLEHKKLKFSGKGKYAKRIKFNAINEISEKDITWLFSEVDRNAPF